jgi:hypothetical protein
VVNGFSSDLSLAVEPGAEDIFCFRTIINEEISPLIFEFFPQLLGPGNGVSF